MIKNILSPTSGNQIFSERVCVERLINSGLVKASDREIIPTMMFFDKRYPISPIVTVVSKINIHALHRIDK